MDNINKLVGSVSQQEFIQGLIQARVNTPTPGHIWEKCVHCPNCTFAEQCYTICKALENENWEKNPTCRDVINLLLGKVRVEDIG